MKTLIAICILSLAAFAQGLPAPSILDTQSATSIGGANLQFTESVKAPGNVLVLVVTCDLTNYLPYPGEWKLGCGAASNSDHRAFIPIEHHGNEEEDWAENEYYLIVTKMGPTTITFFPLVMCAPEPCLYDALLAQIQGVGAD